MRFQYDISVFESELQDIDAFHVGKRYRENIVRRAFESKASNQQTLDPNYFRILLDYLERVARIAYRILSQRKVRPESIQVLFQQGETVRSLKLQRFSDIQSPEVLMNLIRSQLTESVRYMMTPETGSSPVIAWAIVISFLRFRLFRSHRDQVVKLTMIQLGI